MELLEKLDAEWGDVTTVTDMLRDVNGAATRAARTFPGIRSLAVEVTRAAYERAKAKPAAAQAVYEWARFRPEGPSALDYILHNNVARQSGVALRFVVAAE